MLFGFMFHDWSRLAYRSECVAHADRPPNGASRRPPGRHGEWKFYGIRMRRALRPGLPETARSQTTTTTVAITAANTA